MDRNELRGKQTPGEAIVNGGTVYISGASAVYTESQKMNWVEEFAMAALYAEAHNVANRTGMWPEDLEQRMKELEGALAYVAHEAVDAYVMREHARAILNKKP